jgi:5,6,7,8-tetrahydromethanopterin hydro-lyase
MTRFIVAPGTSLDDAHKTICNPPARTLLKHLRRTPLGCAGCNRFHGFQQGETTMSMYVGEALEGDGNEVAHIDLLIGDKAGPVGHAYANALARQSEGHSNLMAVLTPNLICKPATVLITKVTIKGAKQAVQMFGPAQAAVAKAVADSVAEGVIPKSEADNLCIVCGVFIHWEASDNKKIYDYNYKATKLAIARAMKGEPKIDEITAKKDTAKHPFA